MRFSYVPGRRRFPEIDRAVRNSLEGSYPGSRTAPPDERGRFVFTGVVPGNYVVRAMTTKGPLNWFIDTASLAGRDVLNDDAEPGAWFDPGFLRQIHAAGTPLSLIDGERRVLKLRVPDEQ